MFVHEHLAFALVAGLVMAYIGFVSGFKKQDCVLFILGSLAIQGIDIDHYSGDFPLLVECGAIYSAADPLLPVCWKVLHRGVLHRPETFLMAGWVMLALPVLTRRRWLALFFIGVISGWILHLYLDLLI